MKNIALTFDYEIFFGNKSGLPGECIFQPTDRLIDIFISKGMKGTFFIDVLYYLKLLDNPKTVQDALLMKQQLKRIVKQGSRIELHLHPHWIDATYTNGQWTFPTYDRYRLHNVSANEISSLIKKGTRTLEEIAQEVDLNYKVVVFRAGGFCIQPFEKLAIALYENGIYIDSSVVPGLYEKNSVRFMDFRKVPRKDVYRFSDNPIIFNEFGKFIEIPISTYKTNIIDKIINKYKNIIRKEKNFNLKNRGEGIKVSKSIIKKFFPEVAMISPDGNIDATEIIKKINKSEKKLITIISHPKSLTESSFDFFNKISKESYNFFTLNEVE